MIPEGIKAEEIGPAMPFCARPMALDLVKKALKSRFLGALIVINVIFFTDAAAKLSDRVG
jgi:hypothetical protein